jgi:hypothetical protein
MTRIQIIHLLTLLLLATSAHVASAQTDSSQKQLPERLPVDSGMRTLELTPLQTQELQDAVSNPVWYLLTQIAPIFNIGAYYSYLTPTGSFGKQVSGSSALILVSILRVFLEKKNPTCIGS